MQEPTILITILLAALTIVIPERYFLLPYILTACFIPTDQRVIILGLNFTVTRLLVAIGLFRVIFGESPNRLTLNNFDKLLIVWILCGALVYYLQRLQTAAFINRSGTLFEILGLFFIFKAKIKTWADVRFCIKCLAYCTMVIGLLVGLERATGKNPFVWLGCVATAVREGRYRCQASFPHSIMLGLFWATLMPLFIGLIMTGKNKIVYIIAAITSVFIVFCSASSTPLLTMLFVLILLPTFRYRCYAGQFAVAMCALTFALHIVMQAPVWHLIARAGMVGGSTGWHRYHVIDQAIEHVNEWALLGTQTTAHWGYGLEDITNQYVVEGLNGGIFSLFLFIAVLIFAIKLVLRYSLMPVIKDLKILSWCICVSLIGHCISFFGVTYFGQIKILLCLMFSFITMIYERLQVVSDLVSNDSYLKEAAFNKYPDKILC